MPRRMPSARLALALMAGAGLAGPGLAACGAEAPPEVIVTVTRTHSASPGDSPSPARSSVRAAEDVPQSDVEGRRFDFGLVKEAQRVGTTDVLVLDRWTDPRVADDTLAEDGLEVGTWELGSDRYLNQNTQVTFDIPVRDGTTFVLHHCVSANEPLETRSVGARELAAAPEADRLVLVELDDDGWATGGETFAGC